jgi:hypothetical protein
MRAAIECKDHIPIVVNPLTVSIHASGNERLILDLRHINQYIEKRKFEFEGVLEALQYVIKNGFIFKCDLTSGYHHISIHEDHQSYLGFSWKLKNKMKYFIFRVLSFGLSTVGHAFSKVPRPMVKCWRAQGFRVIFYLDEGWEVEFDFDSCSL